MSGCLHCGTGFRARRAGQKYCSRRCFFAARTGPGHPLWKGDTANRQSGRARALRLYPNRPCEKCGSEKSERHHVDGNPLNNVKSNVKQLCRACHLTEHDFVEIGGRGKPRRSIEEKRTYQREYMRSWRRKRAA